MLREHARTEGGDLIIKPTVRIGQGADAKRARLELLRDSIQNEPKLRVALYPESFSENLIIVGDYFSLDAVVPLDRLGFQKSLLSWHAGTVLAQISRFDELMNRLLDGRTLADSRESALSVIRTAIDQIDAADVADGA